MSKHHSPLHESLMLFKHGDAIGESRVAAKADGTFSRKIFHATSFKDYVGNFSRMLQYVRENFHIRQVKDLTPEHISAFFRSLNERGLADSTIQKYIATINKGDAIAKHIGWRPVDALPLVRPEPKGPRLSSNPRPYTTAEADKIIDALSGLRDRRFVAIAQIQRGVGLRVREACALTVKAIRPDGSQLDLTSQDRTKKGRPRFVKITDSKTQQTLQDWRSAAVTSGRKRLFISSGKHLNALIREYQEAFKWATEKVEISHSLTHDMRRTFVAERLDYYLANGLTRGEALKQLSADLGHGRSRMERGLLASYLPTDEE